MDDQENKTVENAPAPPPAPTRDRHRFWMDLLTVVAMPLVTAAVGFTINSSLNARQQRDNNLRLYADMMTRREQADSDLRKDMFQAIMNKFTSVPGDSKSVAALDQQVVNLELLAYNFHDSIDLGPLFKFVRRQIPSPSSATPELLKAYGTLRGRLETVAVEVNERQLTVVGDSGAVVRAGLDISALPAGEAFLNFFSPNAIKSTKSGGSISQLCLTMGDGSSGQSSDTEKHFRRFMLDVNEYDPDTRELLVRLYVSKPLPESQCRTAELDLKSVSEVDHNFRLGLFDFPMIDNTRLTHNERAAVTLTNLADGQGEIVLSYFPASRASLKDKPFIDELEHDLRGGETQR